MAPGVIWPLLCCKRCSEADWKTAASEIDKVSDQFLNRFFLQYVNRTHFQRFVVKLLKDVLLTRALYCSVKWCNFDENIFAGTGNLVIQSVQKSDAGWFMCSAKNLAGTRETKPAELKIIGKWKQSIRTFFFFLWFWYFFSQEFYKILFILYWSTFYFKTSL